MKKRNWKMQVIVLAVLALTALLGFGSAKEAQAAKGDWSGAKKKIIEAYSSYKTEVDVSSCNLNYATEYDSLKSMMGEVVNETPYLFYAATSYTVSRNSSTNQIVKIGLGYTDAYKKANGEVRVKKIKKTRAKIDAAVEEAMTNVNSSMSKLEKAMVLHDYIVQNTTYSEKLSQAYRLTEEGVFLKHKANCQGYSLAYGILLEKAGIPVQYISSDEMSHMWNLVKLNGKWYHVDVTWDDPVDSNEGKDQYGLVRHKNFLCSSAKFEKNGHYGFDTSLATSTKYDGKYWKNVSSSFYYRDGKWLYMNKKGIMERSKLNGGGSTVLYNVSGNTLVRFSENKYYFIAYNNLYLYDYQTNTAATAWKTESKYGDGYYLTQIKYKNNYVYYRVLYNKSHKSGKLSVDKNGKVV